MNTSNESTPATARQGIFPGHRPQVRLFHLLVWVAAMVLLLVTQRSLLWQASRVLPLATEGGWPLFGIFWTMLFSLINDGVAAIGICGLVDAIRRVMRGEPYFQHPGHWLLVIAGGFAVLGIIGAFRNEVAELLEYRSGIFGNVDVTLALGSLLQGWIQVLAFLLAALFHDAGRWWRFFFVVLAVGAVLELFASTFVLVTLPYVRVHWFSGVPWPWTPTQLSNIHFYLNLAPSVLLPMLAITLAAALLADRSRTCRDWPHWAGVLATLWILIRGFLGFLVAIRFAIVGF